jgi:hypothetical protein
MFSDTSQLLVLIEVDVTDGDLTRRYAAVDSGTRAPLVRSPPSATLSSARNLAHLLAAQQWRTCGDVVHLATLGGGTPALIRAVTVRHLAYDFDGTVGRHSVREVARHTVSIQADGARE